jgi:hypothetical protein
MMLTARAFSERQLPGDAAARRSYTGHLFGELPVLNCELGDHRASPLLYRGRIFTSTLGLST